MVGRLVHHQHVGALEDQPAEQHAALLAAGDHFHRLLDLVVGEQHAAEGAAHQLFAALGPLGHPVEQAHVVGEVVGMVLGEIADVGAVGPFHLAAVHRQVADQAAQQGGLADAVGADDGDALAGLDLQAQALEQRLAVIALADVFHGHRLAVQLLVLLEADERADPAGRLDLFQLDLVDLPGAAGGLLGLGGVGREAADEGLQLGDLRLLLGVVRQQALAGLFGGGHVLVVVAREQAQLAVVQVGHVGADAVQEVAIVGNDDHGAVARGEHAFQPADGVDVQVVGRFVEQQHVRVREQRLGQQYAQLPAGSDGAHRAEVLLQRDAQAEQQLAGAGLGGVAVELGELDFQLGHRHAICLAHFRQGVDAVAFGLHRPEFLVAHDHRIDDAEVLVGELVLAQLAQAHVGFQHDLAGARLQVVAEDLHEGRLAATVGADQAVAVAVAELDGNVLEQRLGAELHGDIRGGDQLLYL